MTREEEIIRGAKYSANGTIDDVLAEMYFIRGAEWADQHPKKGLWDTEKVIGWLMNNINNYLVKGRDIDLIYEDLCKAMEN